MCESWNDLAGAAESRFRILALDVDGTLLDRDGTLRPRTAIALARAARSGIRPVLCTGRRYRRALPVAELLRLDTPLICNSGALMKDPCGHRTLWRADFSPELLAEVIAVFRAHREPAVSFTDRDPEGFDFIVTNHVTGRVHFDEFVTLNHPHGEVDPRWQDRLCSSPHFHLCALGTRLEMLVFQEAIRSALPGRVQTFVQKSPRYSGTMCEVLRPDASKWSAVLHLAELWGVDTAEICAVGDDMNDVPMIVGAGLGVAMGHAPPDVLAAADFITADFDHDGLATLIDDVLLA
jgi:5-amino-6-(5-phospho-D-ribitylamino)uracil phosphatase